MFLETIYKKTSTGKIQEWTIEIEGNKYRSITGQIDGKKIVNAWTECTGKNIGKSNETSPEDQAMLEATALRRKNLEKDYVETLVATSESSKYLKPMLANKYTDCKDKIKFPCAYQPKLDGIRCLNKKEGLKSRNGKDIISVPHIHIPDVLKSYDLVTSFDGELYNHEYKEDFNEILSMINKSKMTDQHRQKSKEFVQYWVYDVMMSDSPNMNFFDRNEFLKTVFDENSKVLNEAGWILVPTYICNNEQELDKRFEESLEQGFEGGIIRNNTPYEHKRTNNLLKRKEFQDEEFTILDVIEGVGGRKGTAGSIRTVNKDGKTFNSNIKGNRSYVTELFENKEQYIGKTATIKFFNYTPDGIPRFPFVTKIAREDNE